jgi:hypothetical protein
MKSLGLDSDSSLSLIHYSESAMIVGVPFVVVLQGGAMRLPIIAVSLVFWATCAPAAEIFDYYWTISKSAQDPFINTGQPTGGIDVLFLWYLCDGGGMSAAELTLESSLPEVILAFTAQNGYSNAGTDTSLLLAVGGCPVAPVVAGSILLCHREPLQICFGGDDVTVDCAPSPVSWPNGWLGYSDIGTLPCSNGLCDLTSDPAAQRNKTNAIMDQDELLNAIEAVQGDCDPVSVSPNSWGRVKAIYR